MYTFDHDVSVYLLALLLAPFVASLIIQSDQTIKFETVNRAKRGIILDAVGKILHPKKDERSDVSSEKKFDIKTPLGSFSLSGMHQFHQESASAGSQSQHQANPASSWHHNNNFIDPNSQQQNPFSYPQHQNNQNPFSYPHQQNNQNPFSYPQHQNNQNPFSYPQHQNNQNPFSYPQQQNSQNPFSYPHQQNSQNPFSYPQNERYPLPLPQPNNNQNIHNIPHLHVSVGSIPSSSYPFGDSSSAVNQAFGQYPFQHNSQHQQPTATEANENKEKEEVAILLPSHGYNNSNSQDGGKLNEGGTINVVKKETEEQTNNNTDNGQSSNNNNNVDKDDLIESVFGKPPNNNEESGAGKINVRVGKRHLIS